MKYPIIPPWFDLENLIRHDLIVPTKKSMGKEQNKQSVLETLRTNYSDFLHVFTDGSKSDDGRTGSAFYVPQSATPAAWRLQDFASIASAEMSAIQMATSWLCCKDNPGKAVILTDSNTSLYLIKHRKPKTFIHSTSKIHKNILNLIDNGWTLAFQWIPSHCDVLGNDTADKLANDARNINEIFYPVELNDLNRKIKKQISIRWQQIWDIDKLSTPYGLLKPHISNWFWCRHEDRSLDAIMT